MSVTPQPHITSENSYIGEKEQDPEHLEHGPVAQLGDKPRSEDPTVQANLIYADDEEEPQFHARTYIAVFALFFLNFVQVFALTGPPEVVSSTS